MLFTVLLHHHQLLLFHVRESSGTGAGVGRFYYTFLVAVVRALDSVAAAATWLPFRSTARRRARHAETTNVERGQRSHGVAPVEWRSRIIRELVRYPTNLLLRITSGVGRLNRSTKI